MTRYCVYDEHPIAGKEGEIAERSRASKTLVVEQEVPSLNPGEGTFIVYSVFCERGMVN